MYMYNHLHVHVDDYTCYMQMTIHVHGIVIYMYSHLHVHGIIIYIYMCSVYECPFKYSRNTEYSIHITHIHVHTWQISYRKGAGISHSQSLQNLIIKQLPIVVIEYLHPWKLQAPSHQKQPQRAYFHEGNTPIPPL